MEIFFSICIRQLYDYLQFGVYRSGKMKELSHYPLGKVCLRLAIICFYGHLLLVMGVSQRLLAVPQAGAGLGKYCKEDIMF